MSQLRQAWQRWRESRALARRAIPDALWRRTLKRFKFLPAQGPETEELRRLCSLFLDRKEFTGAQGLIVRDDMAVAIAAQACLPILRLGLSVYDGFVGIVVHASSVRARREAMDEDGIVHAYEEVLSGEAVEGGPVTLSWRDVRGASHTAEDGYNVVIHEFAHVLDMGNGRLDAMPALPAATDKTLWAQTWSKAYSAFAMQVDQGQPTFLDPYGAESLEEFFAVAVETFFVAPASLHRTDPALYDLLRQYFGQDPLTRVTPSWRRPQA